MVASRLAMIIALAAAIAGWLVVPDLRCKLGLYMPAGACSGAGDAPPHKTPDPRPRVDTVVISTYLPAPQPPPDPPPPPPRREALPVQMLRLLTEADLAGKSVPELEIMRNEIFARHGRGFKRSDLQRHFSQFDWYYARYGPDEFDAYHLGELTEIERLNADFLLSYQNSRH